MSLHCRGSMISKWRWILQSMNHNALCPNCLKINHWSTSYGMWRLDIACLVRRILLQLRFVGHLARSSLQSARQHDPPEITPSAAWPAKSFPIFSLIIIRLWLKHSDPQNDPRYIFLDCRLVFHINADLQNPAKKYILTIKMSPGSTTQTYRILLPVQTDRQNPSKNTFWLPEPPSKILSGNPDSILLFRLITIILQKEQSDKRPSKTQP